MTQQPRRIGILGGTFDPIHSGHLDVGTVAERKLALSTLFVIPSAVPPHRRQTHASAFHRFAMVAMAVADHPTWRACDMELRHEGPSYTTDTLQRFHARGYRPSELFFIIGADAFQDIATWRNYPRILDQTHFVVVSRPGHTVDMLRSGLPALASRMVRPARGPLPDDAPAIVLVDEPTTDVSSTTIRQRRAEHLSITGLVVPRVEQHIEQHELYTATTPGGGSDAPPDVAAGRLHGQS